MKFVVAIRTPVFIIIRNVVNNFVEAGCISVVLLVGFDVSFKSDSG